MMIDNNKFNLYSRFHGTQGRFTDKSKEARSNNTQQSKKH